MQGPTADARLSLFRRHWQKHDTGVISAFRRFVSWNAAMNAPNPDLYTRDQSRTRSMDLWTYLLTRGYGVIMVSGTWIGDPGTPGAVGAAEETFFVVDIHDRGKLTSDLITMGQLFEQDSVAHALAGGGYCVTSTNSWPDGLPGRGTLGVVREAGPPGFGGDLRVTLDEGEAADDGMRVLGRFFTKLDGRRGAFEAERVGHFEACSAVEGKRSMSIMGIWLAHAVSRRVEKALRTGEWDPVRRMSDV